MKKTKMFFLLMSVLFLLARCKPGHKPADTEPAPITDTSAKVIHPPDKTLDSIKINPDTALKDTVQ
jgi:hypothetical protein